ncbi:MAG: DUF3622 domain-containing protein [Pseudomonadales bacterium]|nr:DUF3622 domain-containing protein [Pseudomonadales bacterium]
MAKGKYGYRVKQDGDAWVVEITRKVSTKKTSVSKRQDGFSTESEAEEWAKKALVSFLENLEERNKRRQEEKENLEQRKKEKQERHEKNVEEWAKKQQDYYDEQ